MKASDVYYYCIFHQDKCVCVCMARKMNCQHTINLSKANISSSLLWGHMLRDNF